MMQDEFSATWQTDAGIMPPVLCAEAGTSGEYVLAFERTVGRGSEAGACMDRDDAGRRLSRMI